MEQNTSSDATYTTPRQASVGHPAPAGPRRGSIRPGARRHRAWGGLAVTLTTLITAALLTSGISPAGAATAVGLTTNASPSTSLGFEIRATANLSGYIVMPTGTVTFRLFAPGDTSCESAIFTTTVAVLTKSVVSPRYAPQSPGTYIWTSAYSGDGNYLPTGQTACDYPAADVLINKYSAWVGVQAQVAWEGGLFGNATINGRTPTGTISYSLYGPNNTVCSGSPVFTFTAAVNGNGTYASAVFGVALPGIYRWRVIYSGDANNFGSSWTSCNAWGGSTTV